MTQKYLIDISTEDAERKRHNLGRLQKMVDYCHTPECLRHFIIQYFGENDAPVTCDNCGNCKAGLEEQDVTIDAQKVFSCIYRMHERFGLTLVAQVLKGSSEKRVKELHFDQLSTYGLMKERSLADIKLLIQRFVATDYLALTESKYPVLTLQRAAYPVLRGQKKSFRPCRRKSRSRRQHRNSSNFCVLCAGNRPARPHSSVRCLFRCHAQGHVRRKAKDARRHAARQRRRRTQTQKYGQAFLECIQKHV